MYKDYFRLSEMPFSIAPDPRFLFMSEQHREALAHLLFGLRSDGCIVLLTGEVGTGKTTICRSMLEQLPADIDVAFILNPRMSVMELLKTICEEFHITLPPDLPGNKTYVDAIYAKLLAGNAAGRRAILIVDEAQNLDPPVLEQLRLLTNLETNTRKLLQIILIGQPELQDQLAKPELRQVAQRVIARYHLSKLSLAEVKSYVAYRLRISGASPAIFPDSLAKILHRGSGGVPRLINLICDRALLGTYVQGQAQVSAPTLRQAIREVVLPAPAWRIRWPIAASGLAAALIAIVAASGVGNALSGWLPDSAEARVEASPSPAVAVSPAAASPAAVSTAAGSPAAVSPSVSPAVAGTELTAAGSESTAFKALFERYGLKPPGNASGAPCRQAEALGMRCYEGRGSVSALRRLDQPVLIRLAPPGGRPATAVLVALDQQFATLLESGVERRIALNELTAAWRGGYTTIWKAPAGYAKVLVAGQQGPAVIWLRQTLAAVDGVAANGSSLFDAELAGRVRAFQQKEGMEPDGMVGPLTAIRLLVRAGQGGPRLLAAKKG